MTSGRITADGGPGKRDYGPRTVQVSRLLDDIATIQDWPAVATAWRNRRDELWREDAAMDLVTAVAAEERLEEILARSARAAERRTRTAWSHCVPVLAAWSGAGEDAVMAAIQAIAAVAILDRHRFDADYRRLVAPLSLAVPWLLEEDEGAGADPESPISDLQSGSDKPLVS
jgi:hypothetical protein